MNKFFRKPQLTPYEADYAQWCAEQGALLREGRLSDLDRENLAEEIETLGRSERAEIENRLGVLLLHLLKWKFQPAGRSGSWRASIAEQRMRLAKRLRENPSLKNAPPEALAEEYEIARLRAADETRMDEAAFPQECPFSIAEILDPSFFPN
jgi:hypothetical protein